MPRVKGFLKIIKRRPGHPDQGLPGIDEPVDPDYGIDEGEPGIDNELPSPPPGIWPPPTVSHPIQPLPPETGEPGEPGHLPSPPAGSIWPRPPHPVQGLFLVLAHVPEFGWRWIVIDPDGWPKPPVDPDWGVDEGNPPVPQPK